MSTQPPTILVVDDEVDTCRNLSDILTDLGYAVDVAHDGPSALELVRRNAYDVALLDLRMPGMDGLELFHRIRQLRSGTVGIIVTAYVGTDTAERALAAGAWQVLAKPVDFPRLLGLVEEAVGQPLVLIVDDDPDLCQSLRDVLCDRGYRVCLAHDESDAATHLRDTSFRVVLIDMKLPDGDGAGVYRLVREANPQARTVVITGYRGEMEQRVQEVLREGAD
ncbi:MAG TPA: response regulator, partial [Gemmataceae bacterium]|nr:response regulator [Gemmataceae bacterium]